MKKKSASHSAFFNPRVLVGVIIVLAGVSLALFAANPFGRSAARNQQQNQPAPSSIDLSLLPPGFDCSQIHALGIDKQENLRAGAIMIACGLSEGGSGSAVRSNFSQWLQKLLPTQLWPETYGGTDKDLINHPETFPNVTQSETFTAINPTNPNQIVVAYNDSRGRFFS